MSDDKSEVAFVQVGEILLRQLTDGTIWMEQEDCQGFQVKELALVRLEATLQEFYDGNFQDA